MKGLGRATSGLTTQSTTNCEQSSASTTCHAAARRRGRQAAITAAMASQTLPAVPSALSVQMTPSSQGR